MRNDRLQGEEPEAWVGISLPLEEWKLRTHVKNMCEKVHILVNTKLIFIPFYKIIYQCPSHVYVVVQNHVIYFYVLGGTF